jgi:hypothetical protein
VQAIKIGLRRDLQARVRWKRQIVGNPTKTRSIRVARQYQEWNGKKKNCNA